VLDRRLADVVVLAHLAYILFIPGGGYLLWRWPRLIWCHLGAVVLGLVSVTIGFDCPLTSWEQLLRRQGGQSPYSGGFLDHYLSGTVYPHGAERWLDVVFGAAVVVAYLGLARRVRGTRSLSTVATSFS
jgi:Protein of Unknown function (DUF2784)